MKLLCWLAKAGGLSCLRRARGYGAECWRDGEEGAAVGPLGEMVAGDDWWRPSAVLCVRRLARRGPLQSAPNPMSLFCGDVAVHLVVVLW